MAPAAILDFETPMPFLNILTKFHQIWGNCYNSDLQHIDVIRKRLATGIQYGGCRHIELRKTDAVLSFFDQFPPILVGILRLRRTTHPWYRKKAWQSESKMAAAAILNFEKLMPFSHLLTNFHQNWWECCEFGPQHFYDIGIRLATGIQYGGCRHLEFRKTDAVVQTSSANISLTKSNAKRPALRVAPFDRYLEIYMKVASLVMMKQLLPVWYSCRDFHQEHAKTLLWHRQTSLKLKFYWYQTLAEMVSIAISVKNWLLPT